MLRGGDNGRRKQDQGKESSKPTPRARRAKPIHRPVTLSHARRPLRRRVCTAVAVQDPSDPCRTGGREGRVERPNLGRAGPLAGCVGRSTDVPLPTDGRLRTRREVVRRPLSSAGPLDRSTVGQLAKG